ncbi:hypothetical protein [Streptomyces griseorubiginosus]|uniref:hypothetical protein n=1 Tax=Streptomyces griseorubiginosus TaxID=67304 RepID=UPI0033D00F3A
MFPGFELTRREGRDGVRLRVRHGGTGPAVLLLPALQASHGRGLPRAELHGDVVAVWRDWAGAHLEGAPIDSGHRMAEEAPEAIADALRAFREKV